MSENNLINIEDRIKNTSDQILQFPYPRSNLVENLIDLYIKREKIKNKASKKVFRKYIVGLMTELLTIKKHFQNLDSKDTIEVLKLYFRDKK